MLWIFRRSCHIQPKLYLKCPNTYPYQLIKGEGTFITSKETLCSMLKTVSQIPDVVILNAADNLNSPLGSLFLIFDFLLRSK